MYYRSYFSCWTMVEISWTFRQYLKQYVHWVCWSFLYIKTQSCTLYIHIGLCEPTNQRTLMSIFIRWLWDSFYKGPQGHCLWVVFVGRSMLVMSAWWCSSCIGIWCFDKCICFAQHGHFWKVYFQVLLYVQT